MTRVTAWATVLLAAAAAAGCGSADDEAADAATSTARGAGPVATAARIGTPRVLASHLRVPWGIAFLPGRSGALVGERETARILRVGLGGGTPRPVMRVPGVDTDSGEGGLLGLAVSREYRRDKLVYAYYTSARDNRVVRFKLGGPPEPILTGLQRNTFHDGGRIAFGPDGMLYVGTGDAGTPGNAQDPGSRNGKILRIRPDGAIPSDNPSPGSAVFSSGHRNVQGLAFDRQGRLWEDEFGQNARDEVNLIRPGRNYGWPEVEGTGPTRGGRYTNPQVTWPTREASPSGAAIIGSTMYVAALRGERLWEVPLRGSRAGRPRAELLRRFGRLRTAAAAPDGSLWVTTSNNGDDYGRPRSGDDRILRIPRPGG